MVKRTRNYIDVAIIFLLQQKKVTYADTPGHVEYAT
jgi:sulfate adenylyltransferase subunit 1 (EFTu-like GTPase family)